MSINIGLLVDPVYEFLQTNIIRIVLNIIRRIANETSGVEWLRIVLLLEEMLACIPTVIM